MRKYVRKELKNGFASLNGEPSKELLDAVKKMADIAYNMNLDITTHIKQPPPTDTYCKECGTDPCSRLGISYAEDDED